MSGQILRCFVASVWPLKFRVAISRGIAGLFRTHHLISDYIVANARTSRPSVTFPTEARAT
jgi:hypothetical protein